jgi:hypothetical protein
MICCQKNFLMVVEVMVARGLASIHFGEILDCDHRELEVALGCWERPNDIHSPALQRPGGRDELQWSPRPSLMFCYELASFASLDDVLSILCRHWPIETLPKSFSGQGSHCYV